MAADAALGQRPAAIGLDIFDTIVIRRLAGDAAGERVVANQLAVGEGWPKRPTDFVTALEGVRRASGSLALDDWLEALETEHGLDRHDARDAYLRIERELIRAVPGAKDALERMRSEVPVTFISDMHFSASTLRSLLGPLELVADDEEIVTSSDAGVSKADGGLFAIDQVLDCGLTDHAPFIGNDLWSDVAQAKLASLRPRPATVGNLTRFETAMAQQPNGLGPAIAGAARMQRLAAGLEPSEAAEIRVLGGQVIGQSILAFLLWVRRECAARGIKHLVFLARDGELPLEMARSMPADHWSGIELRYLQCGRRAWSLAAAPIVGIRKWIDLGTADDAAFLLHSSTTTPFENLLDRCGLSFVQIDRYNGLARTTPSKRLTTEESEAWRELLRSGALDDLILEAAQEPRRRIVDHLKQSGFPLAQTALIDVGWRGQQAWLISALVREATGQEPLHLHFGGDRIVPNLGGEVEIERFAFDDSRRPHPISSPVACLEMFLASGKARLVGYERDDEGDVHEVFEQNATSVDNPTRRLAAAGAIELAALFPSRTEIDDWRLEETALIEETRAVLAHLWNTPSKREAELLTGLRFEGDDGGSIVGPVVHQYAVTEILGRAAQPRIWREASLRMTPFPFRPLMQIYFAARRTTGQ